MNNSYKNFYMIFVPNNQSPEVLKPGKQALDLASADCQLIDSKKQELLE